MNPSILILGRQAGMMQQVINFLRQHNFTNIKGVLTNTEVMNELQTGKYSILIIGGGVDAATRKEITQFITENKISTKTVEHFGNPASLIDEIKTAL